MGDASVPHPDRTLPPLVVIVGPTAVGKTDVAVRLAGAFEGEIVSADSRQVYRGMDIGTAKPTREEQHAAPHHLIDILNPDERLSLDVFQAHAYRAIDEILSRGRLPLLAGGTGQYVQAVVEGWGIPRVPPQPALRAELAGMADVYGPSALHTWLESVDPDAASAIDYRNVRRVIRALEVFLVSGKPISALQAKHPPPYRVLKVGLTRPRASLCARIDARVDQMMAEGLEDEVRRLLASGYSWGLASMSGLGYIQFAPYFRGEASLEETVKAIKRETHRFVRQQYTWFRLDDPSITWFDLDRAGVEAIYAFVESWLAAAGWSRGASSRSRSRSGKAGRVGS